MKNKERLECSLLDTYYRILYFKQIEELYYSWVTEIIYTVSDKHGFLQFSK